LGGQHGVGFVDTWEQDVIDVKSREFYEAPAAKIILNAHRNLERVCLPKDELRFKAIVETEWSGNPPEKEWCCEVELSRHIG
jgi:argininosuccinate synthase